MRLRQKYKNLKKELVIYKRMMTVVQKPTYIVNDGLHEVKTLSYSKEIPYGEIEIIGEDHMVDMLKNEFLRGDEIKKHVVVVSHMNPETGAFVYKTSLMVVDN